MTERAGLPVQLRRAVEAVMVQAAVAHAVAAATASALSEEQRAVFAKSFSQAMGRLEGSIDRLLPENREGLRALTAEVLRGIGAPAPQEAAAAQ